MIEHESFVQDVLLVTIGLLWELRPKSFLVLLESVCYEAALESREGRDLIGRFESDWVWGAP